MTDLQHRIRVFVYRVLPEGVRYLLLRRSVGIDPTWGPVEGRIEFDEQIEAAIRREVVEDVGLARHLDLIDLQMPAHWLLGDEEVIEWPYGLRTPAEEQERVLDVRWSESLWTDFGEAYSRLQLDNDRAAVTRLHTRVSAA